MSLGKTFWNLLQILIKFNFSLVSYAIGDDTLRLAEWLRKFGIKIFCVEFEYFKSKNKEIFVPKLLSSVEETKRIERKTLTETQEKYLRFFQTFSQASKKLNPVTERRAATDCWLQIPAGFNPIQF